MNLKDLWMLYEADKRILGFSSHTMKAYALQLKMLVLDLGDLELEEISLVLLKDYLARVSERLKPSSLGHRIRFVRSLFRFAFEEGHLTRNPSIKLREPKMDKRIPKFLIEEDVIHLKITCRSHREHALLEFLYCTGCRVGEVQKINLEDINWENCSAIVNGKGSKQREVYFTTECKVWLKRYMESRNDTCKALFVTETNPVRRLSIPTIRWSLKKLAKRGDITANVYPHRFRHTYACQLLDNGAPLEFIQGMLGHEKASTTQIYAQLRGERRRELYRRYF
ncbi:site-specific recombinase XerD [Paenibacillus sp. V4I3]|uniref:tyrosine-type recombinase/integrase n=1 Tax=unclassified Paenibacillus TaxID=185978 RepID=UPI002786A66B|nr:MULTISPECIES: tyrosine-type recombinase/integrase [unclassified Paenibacillus]MDQ0874385.1 site-specific recombinase XerD [Paenibacillus sp. V4I3]MDQ0888533.1 site-specific recombinase XerD [Paenibacillus sp. V4I9]